MDDDNYEKQFETSKEYGKSEETNFEETENSIVTLQSNTEKETTISPKNIIEQETIETIPTSSGGTIKVTRYIKDIVDKSNDKPYGQEVREIKEETDDGRKKILNVTSETILGDDGTRIKKTTTTTTSVKKYTFGDSTKIDETARKSAFEAELSTERFPKFFPIDKSSSFKATSFSSLPRFTTQDTNKNFEEYFTKISDYERIMPIQSISKEVIAPTFAYELDDLTIQKGDIAYFEGTVNGTAPFEIIWLLDDKLLKLKYNMKSSVREEYTEINGQKITDYKISLEIRSCTFQDIGKYTLQVKNSGGDASSYAFLVIEGKGFNNIRLS